MTRVLPPLACALAILLPSLMALAALPRAGTGPVLVLHGPWTDGGALIRLAGGSPVGLTTAPMGTLATSDDTAGFPARLRAAGAWAVLDGAALAQICGASDRTDQGFST